MHDNRPSLRVKTLTAVFGLALAQVTSANTLVVKGELTFSSTGIGKIADCESGREFTLGIMASTPYFELVRQYWALSDQGKKPVLIEVRGEVMKTSDPKTESTLQSPTVVTLVAGACDKK